MAFHLSGFTACAPFWRSYGNDSYLVSEEERDASDAETACNSSDATLLQVFNQPELDFITSLTDKDNLRFRRYFIMGFCNDLLCSATGL